MNINREDLPVVRRALQHALNSLKDEERRLPTGMLPDVVALVTNERAAITRLIEEVKSHEKA